MLGVSQILITLAAIGVPVLGLAGLYCLLFCKEEEHYKHLVRTAAVFLGATALLTGGGFPLNCFGLVWRSGPAAVLFGVMVVSGWIGLLLVMACLLPRPWPLMGAVLRRTIKGTLLFLAALVLLVVLWLGPILMMFAFGDTEKVVEYRGQTLLEVDDGFLDPHYSYYAYHGPLFRGTERIYDGYESPLKG